MLGCFTAGVPSDSWWKVSYYFYSIWSMAFILRRLVLPSAAERMYWRKTVVKLIKLQNSLTAIRSKPRHRGLISQLSYVNQMWQASVRSCKSFATNIISSWISTKFPRTCHFAMLTCINVCVLLGWNPLCAQKNWFVYMSRLRRKETSEKSIVSFETPISLLHSTESAVAD